MLANMDLKPDKPKNRKPNTKATPKTSSYLDCSALPPVDDDEEEEYPTGEGQKNKERSELKPIEVGFSDKEMRKRKKKDLRSDDAIVQAKHEALKDDRDAFIVTIGTRASVLDGEDDGSANVKDITVEKFDVSVHKKELLRNASVKISHGKIYGLVGPNGTGKSTLLKLLAWRKNPVPKNIDVLLVEQEVVGDDKTALEAVVSANEELVKLRQEDTSLQKKAEEENDDDVGEKLAELYEKLQLLGSDAAEAQASKIHTGLGFTKEFIYQNMHLNLSQSHILLLLS